MYLLFRSNMSLTKDGGGVEEARSAGGHQVVHRHTGVAEGQAGCVDAGALDAWRKYEVG